MTMNLIHNWAGKSDLCTELPMEQRSSWGAAVVGDSAWKSNRKKKSLDRKGPELRIHNLTANCKQPSCRGFLSVNPQIYCLAGVLCTAASKLSRFLLRSKRISTQPRIFTRSKNYQSFISVIGPRCYNFFISHRKQKYNRFTEHICWLFICRIKKRKTFNCHVQIN